MAREKLIKTTTLSAGILLVAALLGIVNYFGGKYYHRFDWTSTRLYSLSEKSEKVLAALDKDVDVAVLMSGDQGGLFGPTKELLDRYAAASPHIKVRIVDPARNVIEARRLAEENQIQNASVVFSAGSAKKIVDAGSLAEYDYSTMAMGGEPKMSAFKGEQMFTNALVQLGQGARPKVRFTTGHGEASLDGTDGRGLASLRALLSDDGYDVEEWASLGQSAVPAGTDLLVIAGPTANFVPPEADVIAAYLDGGGRLLALLDPILPRTGTALVASGLDEMLAKYGVRLGNDLVVDPANPLPMFGAETLFTNSYAQHPIVEPLERQNLPILINLARSVGKSEGAAGDVSELLRTSVEGWGETDLASANNLTKDPADTAGPVSLGVAVGGPPPAEPPSEIPTETPKAEERKARLVVLGDSDFATNQFWNANVGNSTLAAGAVNWLVDRSNLIAIAPKSTEQTKLSLTSGQMRNVILLVLALLPSLVVALGLWTHFSRRKRA